MATEENKSTEAMRQALRRVSDAIYERINQEGDVLDRLRCDELAAIAIRALLSDGTRGVEVGCIKAGCFGRDPVFHRPGCRHAAKPGPPAVHRASLTICTKDAVAYVALADKDGSYLCDEHLLELFEALWPTIVKLVTR